MKTETKGILLLAIGKPAYIQFAVNMALSIREYGCELPIHLVYGKTDKGELLWNWLPDDEKALFTSHEEMKEVHYQDIIKKGIEAESKLSPGKAKLHINLYSPFDKTIYIDVDGLCVRDLTSLFDLCDGYFHSQTVKVFTENDEVWACQWMNFENVKRYFPMPKTYNIYELNSSFQYFTKEAAAFYEKARTNYNEPIPKEDFGKSWGGSFPDELALNVATAQMGIDPTIKGCQYPVYFRNRTGDGMLKDKGMDDPLEMIQERHYILGLYGDYRFNHHSIVDDFSGYYNRILHPLWHKELKRNNPYKSASLMRSKHVLSK